MIIFNVWIFIWILINYGVKPFSLLFLPWLQMEMVFITRYLVEYTADICIHIKESCQMYLHTVGLVWLSPLFISLFVRNKLTMASHSACVWESSLTGWTNYRGRKVSCLIPHQKIPLKLLTPHLLLGQVCI